MPGMERGFHLHIATELIVGLAFDFDPDADADMVDAELVAGGLQVSAHSQIVDRNEDRRELRKDILAVTGEFLGVHVNAFLTNCGVGAAVPVDLGARAAQFLDAGCATHSKRVVLFQHIPVEQVQLLDIGFARMSIR